MVVKIVHYTSGLTKEESRADIQSTPYLPRPSHWGKSVPAPKHKRVPSLSNGLAKHAP